MMDALSLIGQKLNTLLPRRPKKTSFDFDPETDKYRPKEMDTGLSFKLL
jgi:hypothetical protein